MIGFRALTINTNTITDAYDAVQEKKNDIIASTIANHSSNKDRACAVAIGASFGALQSGLYTGTYVLGKMFPQLQKFYPIKWAVGKVDDWVKIAKANNPAKSGFYHFCVGTLSKSLWMIGTGALSALLIDFYINYQRTKTDGKVGKCKKGQLDDSWLVSGLKSLSNSKNGRALIKDAVEKTDDGYIVKFKGVDKQYHVSSKELKAANKTYLTLFDDKGKVKGYRKYFASGDADVLAFENAFKKYHQDLRLGKIKSNPNLPSYANQYSSSDNLSETTVDQLYYFVTGKESQKITNNFFSNSEKTKLDNFISDFSSKSKTQAATFRFNEKSGETVMIKDRFSRFGTKEAFSTKEDYAIKSINDNYVVLCDYKNTSRQFQISIEDFKQNFGSITAVDLNS